MSTTQSQQIRDLREALNREILRRSRLENKVRNLLSAVNELKAEVKWDQYA